MNIHNRKNLKPWLVPATLLVILASVFVARTAFAKIAMNTIDPVGIVADKGRQVTVTGPIAVTKGERTELRVTVTQRSTGAVAEGVIFLTGTGQTSHWELTAQRKLSHYSRTTPQLCHCGYPSSPSPPSAKTGQSGSELVRG